MGVALTDKPDKFIILIQNGEKVTKQEFPSDKEALAFLPKVLDLKKKAKDLRVKLRVDFGDGLLYAPHFTSVLFTKAGDMIPNLSTGMPMRDYKRSMPITKKGHMYCPECGFESKFKPGDYATPTCEHCGISENDFYVKGCNGLWPTMKG